MCSEFPVSHCHGLVVACSIVPMADRRVGCGFLSSSTNIPRCGLETDRHQLSTERKDMQPEPETVVIIEQTCAFAGARLLKDKTR